MHPPSSLTYDDAHVLAAVCRVLLVRKATQENYEHIGCCVRVFEVVIGLP